MKEVEDQAPKFGVEGLEARFARVPIEAELIGITYQRLDPDLLIPWGHKHKTQEEILVVVTGSATVKLGDDLVDLGPWDAVRVHKDTMRGLRAGPDGCEVLVVGAPGGPGDAELEPGWWSD